MTRKAATQPIYRTLADSIAQDILAGQIKPGEQLPSETSLAERFGVHRSTVREGIRLLEETGMLARKSQKRLMVAVPDSANLSDRTVRALVMKQVTVRELYEANRAMDPLFARIAAENASGAQIERLRRNLRETRAAAGDPAGLGALDAEFHVLVCAATNNEIFETMRQPLHELFMPMVSDLIASIDTSDRMIAAHERIVEAIAARNAAAAEDWARRHIEDFRRGYELAALDFDKPISYSRTLP